MFGAGGRWEQINSKFINGLGGTISDPSNPLAIQISAGEIVPQVSLERVNLSVVEQKRGAAFDEILGFLEANGAGVFARSYPESTGSLDAVNLMIDKLRANHPNLTLGGCQRRGSREMIEHHFQFRGREHVIHVAVGTASLASGHNHAGESVFADSHSLFLFAKSSLENVSQAHFRFHLFILLYISAIVKRENRGACPFVTWGTLVYMACTMLAPDARLNEPQFRFIPPCPAGLAFIN